MTLRIYPVVLQLVRTLCDQLEPELGALFQRVIGTLVRLVEPRR